MSEGDVSAASPAPGQRRWQPLEAIERRVAGVLAEKAKTTPDAYPMSLNAICTGCNQKSNRSPLMQLESDDVEQALERLRELGAVGMIEGYGRVAKYRHYLYEWLGVDKVELAVMTELLLRGAQTVGELRGRAARMEPIPDLQALHPILESLKSKELVLALTPEGRGQVVTHVLYQPRELENLRAQYSQARASGASIALPGVESPAAEQFAGQAAPALRSSAGSAPASPSIDAELIAAIRRDISELRAQLMQLQSDVRDLFTRQQQCEDELHGLKESLGG